MNTAGGLNVQQRCVPKDMVCCWHGSYISNLILEIPTPARISRLTAVGHEHFIQ